MQRRTDREAGVGLMAKDSMRSAPMPGITVMLERSSRSQIQADMARLAGYGFRWARQRLDWAELEPQPGMLRLRQLDDRILGIVEGGLEPVLLLDGSPQWARAEVDRDGDEGRFAPPQDPADLARFAAALAARYGDVVRYYQIWDEPNIAPHWGNRHIDPVAYTALLRTVARAIRAEDADAVILAGALAPTADRGHTAIDEVTFLRRMIAAGALDVPYGVDAVVVQPFGFGATAEDPRQQVDVLNFSRLLWVRRALVDAGYAHVPIWAARIGWSTRLDSPWRTVSPENQIAFARDAFHMARSWPWLAAIGWAVDRPALPAVEPLWGFALTPQLGSAIAAANEEPAAQPPDAARRDIAAWALIVGGFVLVTWRAIAAGRRLPLRSWLAHTASLPARHLAASWAILAILYHLATWPPWIALCWIAALWLALANPRSALYLAAATLPFYFQHKQVQLVTVTLNVPPAHLLATCLAIATIAHKRAAIFFQIKPGLTALLLGWLAFNALSALNVWHWPAYGQGVIDLALIPVLLGWAVWMWAESPVTTLRVAIALAAGGAAAALVGLALWSMGGGTEADGVRRLVGPHFSPNHTALYLERCLFVGLGVAWAGRRQLRFVALTLCAVMAAALLLTGSRGALLLGIPGGIAYVGAIGWALANMHSQRPRLRPRWMISAAILVMALLAAVAWLYAGRLANSATIRERIAIWDASLRLFATFPWTGTGPGGFHWRFPAFISTGGSRLIDPNLHHPHSLWLEFATFWGIAGLIWLAALLLWLGRQAIQLLRYPARPMGRLQAGLAAAFAAALLHAQVDAFWALSDLAAWNALALGLWAASMRTHVKQKP